MHVAEKIEDDALGNDILKKRWKGVSKNKKFQVRAWKKDRRQVFEMTGDKVNADSMTRTQLGSVVTNSDTVARLQAALDELAGFLEMFSEIPIEELEMDAEKAREEVQNELKWLLEVAREELIKAGLQKKDELLKLYVDFARVVPPGELAKLQADDVYFETKLGDFLDGFPERFAQSFFDVIFNVLKDVQFLKDVLLLRNDERALGELGRLIDAAMDGEKGIEEARLQILRGDLGVVEFFRRRKLHPGLRKYFQLLLQDPIAWKIFIMEVLNNWPNDAYESGQLLAKLSEKLFARVVMPI